MNKSMFREIRLGLGLTQERLALAMQLGKDGARTVRRWEMGERAIPGPVAVLMQIWKENLFP